jgi:hypothetical protein
MAAGNFDSDMGAATLASLINRATRRERPHRTRPCPTPRQRDYWVNLAKQLRRAGDWDAARQANAVWLRSRARLEDAELEPDDAPPPQPAVLLPSCPEMILRRPPVLLLPVVRQLRAVLVCAPVGPPRFGAG